MQFQLMINTTGGLYIIAFKYRDQEFDIIHVPFDQQITNIESSHDHNFILSDGKLFAYGRNRDSQLGIPYKGKIRNPEQVNIDADVIGVSCGGRYTLINTDKGVYFTGKRQNNNIMVSSDSKYKRVILPTLRLNYLVKNVFCSDDRAFVDSFGGLFAIGSNSFGKLGIYSGRWYGEFKELTPVPFDGRVDDVKLGSCFTLVLSEGLLFCFGAIMCFIDKTKTKNITPAIRELIFDEAVDHIACSATKSLIYSDNKLFSYSYNYSGIIPFDHPVTELMYYDSYGLIISQEKLFLLEDNDSGSYKEVILPYPIISLKEKRILREIKSASKV